MGQYYHAVVGKKDAKSKDDIKVFSPFNVVDENGEDAGSCYKLLEHGWVGNFYCLCIEKQLYKNPQRVAWVGDYVEEDDLPPVMAAAKADYVPAPEEVWGKDVKTPKQVYDGFTTGGKFLVNHTTKQYIDMDAYIERCSDADGWQVNPLVVLTAIGNGRGGGDYVGEAGEEDVGTWAWHIISIEDEAPSGYEAFEPTFFDD